MDDDRGNNEKRVVRTEKDKKWNLIKDITAKITSALNNQDFEKVWNQLQELLKEIEKAQKIIDKEGYPPLFLRCLKKINDEINEFNENAEAKKKMKKHSATAFNTMKQKLKKIYPEF
jgi:translation initiation factor 3 subunit C